MNLVKLFIAIIVFLFGILIGFTIENFPLLEWKREIKVYEVFQVLSTLFIGLIIPFVIKKWIDDSRLIKSLVSEEAKDIVADTKKIRDKLQLCFEKKVITEDDKQALLLMFSQIENAISLFQKNLQIVFGDKIHSDFQDLRIAYFEYENGVTGGDLMSVEFTNIDLDYLASHALLFNEFNNSIRAFLIKLQKI